MTSQLLLRCTCDALCPARLLLSQAQLNTHQLFQLVGAILPAWYNIVQPSED